MVLKCDHFYLLKFDMMMCGRMPFIWFSISSAACFNNFMVKLSVVVITLQFFESTHEESCYKNYLENQMRMNITFAPKCHEKLFIISVYIITLYTHPFPLTLLPSITPLHPSILNGMDFSSFKPP